jgi:hypothetical protein
MLGIGGVSGHYLYPRTIEVETGRIIERTLPPSEEDIVMLPIYQAARNGGLGLL